MSCGSMENQAGPSSSPRVVPQEPSAMNETIASRGADIDKSGTKKNPKAKPKPIPIPKPQARPKPIPKPIEAFQNPDEGEEETVHEVYERIAPHFSQTRYKVSPCLPPYHFALPLASLPIDGGYLLERAAEPIRYTMGYRSMADKIAMAPHHKVPQRPAERLDWSRFRSR